jgi:4-oxalocrotonate tautomerase
MNERSRQMPVITIDIGRIDKEKKTALVRELTLKASEVTQIPADKFIVLINEMERDNIGVGGKLLSEIL